MSAATLSRLGVVEIRRLLQSGEISASDLVQALLTQIEATEPQALAWTYVAAEQARARAKELDASRARGEAARALTGVPIGVKDIFNTADMPTQMGSAIWKGFTPGNDARVVYSVRQAGAVILGKTATAEFAVHQLGTTLNPHDPSRNPGTSSSGSAAAVASFHVPAALGTQTAGSVVRPASYCGVYGYKPSFGLLPRTGMLKTTDSLDTIGMLARKAEDLRCLFDVMRVRGRDYPVSDAALNDASRQTKKGRPWRVLLARPYTWELVRDYTRDAFAKEMHRWATSMDVELVERPLPEELRAAHEVHSTIYEFTLAYYFAEEYRKRDLVSPVLTGMIERGQKIHLDAYKAALERQAQIARAMDTFLQDIDVIALPSVAGEAPLRDEEEVADSCLIWTLCGLPTISVPAMVGPNGLPIGIQLVGRRYNDYLLLNFLDALTERGLAPAGPHPVPARLRG